MVSIKQNLVGAANHKNKCPYAMTKPQSITVHNTANDAAAANEVKYMISNTKQISYHYAVDDNEIVQGISDNRNAWHCGNRTGNLTSLSVEICYSKSGGERFAKAEKNAAELIAKKLQQYGLKISDVKTHKAWNGKDCPHRTMQLGWDRFLKMVEGYYKGSSAPGGGSQGGGNSPEKPVSGLPNLSRYTGSSLVDGLKSVNYDASFDSRKKLAAKLGISNYSGTAEQNSKMLKMLR